MADRRPHIVLRDATRATPFTSPKGFSKARWPDVDREQHGRRLEQQLARIHAELQERGQGTLPIGVPAPEGFVLEFEGFPGYDLALDRMESAKKGIEKVGVRRDGDTVFAQVYVPLGSVGFFAKKMEEFLTEDSPKSGQPKNRPLVSSIANIRLAIAESFWTDDRSRHELLIKAVRRLVAVLTPPPLSFL